MHAHHQLESGICWVRVAVGSLSVHALITYGLPLIRVCLSTDSLRESICFHALVLAQAPRAAAMQVAEIRLEMPAKHTRVRNNTTR